MPLVSIRRIQHTTHSSLMRPTPRCFPLHVGLVNIPTLAHQLLRHPLVPLMSTIVKRRAELVVRGVSVCPALQKAVSYLHVVLPRSNVQWPKHLLVLLRLVEIDSSLPQDGQNCHAPSCCCPVDCGPTLVVRDVGVGTHRKELPYDVSLVALHSLYQRCGPRGVRHIAAHPLSNQHLHDLHLSHLRCVVQRHLPLQVRLVHQHSGQHMVGHQVHDGMNVLTEDCHVQQVHTPLVGAQGSLRGEQR
mmetsp:Transcript_49716/g.108567  ORF Transcript_49716/g.108567 Transcript_49716/m.108567 type:complete len:245 (-) Transcript_49716:100-834(-)